MIRAIDKNVLYDMMVNEFISEQDFEDALQTARMMDRELRFIAFDEFDIDPDFYMSWMARSKPTIDLYQPSSRPAQDALESVPRDLAEKYEFLPLFLRGRHSLVIATNTPGNGSIEIRQHSKRKPKITIPYQTDLPFAIQCAYSGQWNEYILSAISSKSKLYDVSPVKIKGSNSDTLVDPAEMDFKRALEFRHRNIKRN